ncbi:MAG: dihydrodipicolinate synthase family protein [Beijerinckiaceae bacterium]
MPSSARPKFGISPALATPIAKDGTVHVNALVAHTNDLLARGCTSATIFGTTGEGPSFGLSERERTAAGMIAAGIPAAKIVEGIIACSHEEAVASLSGAYARGAKAVLFAPPFYFRDNPDDALFAWFDGVFRALGAKMRDIILYHIPSMTGVPISFDVITRLKKAYPGVILGVKDSSGDSDHTMRLIDAHGDLTILVGDERYLGAAVAKGASGSICGCSNFLPEQLVRVVADGKDDAAVQALVDAICAHPVIPAVKALAAHVTGEPAFFAPRPPLAPLSAAATQELTRALDAIRFKKEAAE